ncbi:MAG: hypothetical protein WCY37_03065 [Candidatus Dojkabacteria bacterium]
MKRPKNLRKSLSVVLIVPLFLSFILVQLVLADTTQTTLNQLINAGTLAIDIVDGTGTSVVSPSVAFGAVTFSFDPQDATGTLGTASEKIRLSNPTTTVAWNVSMAATGGPGTTWTTGTYTYPFDSTGGADTGRLTVNPTTGTITPIGAGCTNTSVSLGASGFFLNATTNSIDIMAATTGADIGCRWDLTGVSLTQRIPAGQQAGSYTLGMTITAL